MRSLAAGRPPHGRPCDILVKGYAAAEGLLYYREGAHFIVYRKDDGNLVVIDFVHERRDLPRMIERLMRSKQS